MNKQLQINDFGYSHEMELRIYRKMINELLKLVDNSLIDNEVLTEFNKLNNFIEEVK